MNAATNSSPVKGYAPAGSWRSLVLLVSVVALAGGLVAAFQSRGEARELGLWSSALGVVVFVVVAGSVDRISIDLEGLTCRRRKGVPGWFRPPVIRALSEARGVALGRRKLSARSGASWAPLLVWPDGCTHVLSTGDGHNFSAAGREVRHLASVSGLEILEGPEEFESGWQIVPLAMADRKVGDPITFVTEVFRESGKGDDDHR